MKSSFYKRAIATVSVVPIAFAQCLGVANAVDVNDTAADAETGNGKTIVALDTGNSDALLYIAPNETGLAYERDESAKTFTKISNWNSEVQNLIQRVANGDRKEGVLDLTKAYEQAIKHSGKYSDVTAQLIEKIGDVTYSVNENGTIIIKGSLDDITPIYTEAAENTVGGALKELADKYNVPELANTEDIFGGVVIAGDFEATIDATDVENYNVSGSVKFTDRATGDVYTGSSILDWAIKSFNALKQNAKEKCDEYSDVVDTTDAYKQIDESMSFYTNKLETAKRSVDRALKVNRDGNWDTDKVNDIPAITPIIKWVSKQVQKRTGKNIASTTASELVATEKFQNAFDIALEQAQTIAGDNFTFQVTPEELGVLGDSFYEIEGHVHNGVATLKAKFPDQEAEAAIGYLEGEYGVDVTEVHKEVEVEVNFTDVKTSGASANAIVKRVATYEDVVTTTTTTTTTEATDTTTTAVTNNTDENGSDVTTAATDENGSDVTTTATDGNGSDVTTAATDGNGSDVTTAATDGNGSDVTTAATDENGSDVTTTATNATDENGSDITTTATRTETKYVNNFYTQTTAGFYLDTDAQFNIGQVDSISYAIDYSLLTYGEDGTLLSQEILTPGEQVDIKSLVEFKDTPSEVFNKDLNLGLKQFVHQVPLYATEDITAADGTVVATAGTPLKNVDGSNVTAKAYIGLKGDTELDLDVESTDASVVLGYYAQIQSGGAPADTQFAADDSLIADDAMMDDFIAFLGDVNNESNPDNYKLRKPAREIISDDASYILGYYAATQAGDDLGKATWDKVLAQ